jgi:hypothetical protein
MALKLAPNCLFKHARRDKQNSETDRLACGERALGRAIDPNPTLSS